MVLENIVSTATESERSRSWKTPLVQRNWHKKDSLVIDGHTTEKGQDAFESIDTNYPTKQR